MAGSRGQTETTTIRGSDSDNVAGVTSSNELLVAGSNGDGSIDVTVVAGGGGVAALAETDIYVDTITAATDNEVIAAQGAGNKISIHKIILANQDIPCQIRFRFGAGTYWGHVGLPSKLSTRVLTFSPAITATDANENFNAVSDTASVDVDITVIAEVVT